MAYNKFHTIIPEKVVCTHKTNFVGLTNDYHSHNNYEIYLMLNGETNLFFDHQGYCMTRGKGVFIKSNVLHRFEYVNKTVYNRINIHIKDSYFPSLNSAESDLASILNCHKNGTHTVFTLTEEQIHDFTIKSIELEKALHNNQFGDDIISECLLRQLLVKVNRVSENSQQVAIPNVSMPPLVSAIIAYIHENLTEDLSINTLAKIFHHNGHYISRRFKDTLDLPLQQYIILKRLEVAKSYLTAGYPLMNVCFLSGYNDYSNFAKTFSKYVGQSPKKYQRQTMNL